MLQIAIAGAYGDQTLESAQAAIYTLAQGEGMTGPDLLNAAFDYPWTLEELEGHYREPDGNKAGTGFFSFSQPSASTRDTAINACLESGIVPRF